MNETKVNELVLNLINTKVCINTLTDKKKSLKTPSRKSSVKVASTLPLKATR